VQFAVSPEGRVSGYLVPIPSPFEQSLGNQWDRVISTFSLKLFDPNSKELIASKCLTGAFFFSSANPLAGWDEFTRLETITMTGTAEVLMKVHVTWDPSLLSEHTILGKTKQALTQAKDLDNVETESLKRRLATAEMSLAKKELGLQELEAVRHRLMLLSSELSECRAVEKEYSMSQIRFGIVKEKLAHLRAAMETDFSTTAVVQDSDPAQELEACRSQLAAVFHEKAQIELKLSQALSELQFINRSSRDNLLLAPIASHNEDIDPLEKVQLAIETAKNETLVGVATLDEVKEKVNDRPLSSISSLDRSGLIADMSMVQCGLDVANATLQEAAEYLHLLKDVSEFLDVQKHLQEVRLQFIQTKISLEDTNLRRASSAFLSIQTTGIQTSAGLAPSPTPLTGQVSPPPIVPSVIPKNRGKRSSAAQFSELEQVNDLKIINTKIETLSDMLKTTVIVPSGESSRPFRPADIPPWTPKDEKASLLDQVQLQMLLKEVKRGKSSTGTLLSTVFVFISLLFMAYSAVFVICNDRIATPGYSLGPVCESVILPAWKTGHNYWHKASELVVIEVLPSYGRRVTSGVKWFRRFAEDTLHKAVKQGNDAAVAPKESHDAIHPLDPEAPKTELRKATPLADSTTSQKNPKPETETAIDRTSTSHSDQNTVVEPAIYTNPDHPPGPKEEDGMPAVSSSSPDAKVSDHEAHVQQSASHDAPASTEVAVEAPETPSSTTTNDPILSSSETPATHSTEQVDVPLQSKSAESEPDAPAPAETTSTTVLYPETTQTTVVEEPPASRTVAEEAAEYVDAAVADITETVLPIIMADAEHGKTVQSLEIDTPATGPDGAPSHLAGSEMDDSIPSQTDSSPPPQIEPMSADELLEPLEAPSESDPVESTTDEATLATEN
ncbi:hypothetical protein HDU91_005327, partial [Kappamyces sp. JEL0680]